MRLSHDGYAVNAYQNVSDQVGESARATVGNHGLVERLLENRLPHGAFAPAPMRQAFDVAYQYAPTERRGGPVPSIEYQPGADVLVDAKGRIEAVRLLARRAPYAVMTQDPAGPELALHARIFASGMGVEVTTRLMNVVGVHSYDNHFPLMTYLSEALACPVIEGSNVGICRQLQDLLRAPGYNSSALLGWRERKDHPATTLLAHLTGGNTETPPECAAKGSRVGESMP